MRTSASQFELMVSFMEEHGDINKPSSDARGRLTNMRYWERLTEILNSDGGGDTKTTDKWKKVWSDFKNNTKKKAARLHKAAVGTGGGPALLSKLTDLEQRVLRLVGVQVATGLPAEEAGLSQRITHQPRVSTPPPPTPPLTQWDPQVLYSCQPCEEPSPSTSPHIASVSKTVPRSVEVEVEWFQPWDVPGPSTEPHIAPVEATTSAQEELENIDTLIPTRPATSPTISRPGPTPHRVQPTRVRGSDLTPRHARSTRTRGSPRRRVRPAHTEQAAQHFLNSDKEWRQFKMQQHKDNIQHKRELNRIRTMELQGQREWQMLGARVLDIFDKFVNKYCNN